MEMSLMFSQLKVARRKNALPHFYLPRRVCDARVSSVNPEQLQCPTSIAYFNARFQYHSQDRVHSEI